MGSRKVHELPKGYKWVIVDAALFDGILRAVMEVLWVGGHILPIGVWKIVMGVHRAVDMPPLPMI
jgi:hypothetical protein